MIKAEDLKSNIYYRIAAIAEYIEEEDAEKEQEEVDKNNVLTDMDILNDNKIKHIIEGNKKKDHKWEKVFSRKDWKEIKKIIKEVIETGKDVLYKEKRASKIKKLKKK